MPRSKDAIAAASSVLLLGAIVVVALWSGLPRKEVILRGPGGEEIPLTVEVAETDATRDRGLMYRRSVSRGMLFVFPQQQPLSFWMKNTFVPLDILFFDTAGAYVGWHSMQPCTKDPCRSYPSQKPAMYALEVAAGFIAKNGISRGWTLVLE